MLARWNRPVDDSNAPIKWLGLTFSTDLPARGSATFDLVQAPAAVPPTKIAWAAPDGIHVDTGALGFRVAYEGDNLLEDLRIDMNGDQRLDVRLVGDRGAESLSCSWPEPPAWRQCPRALGCSPRDRSRRSSDWKRNQQATLLHGCWSGYTPTGIGRGYERLYELAGFRGMTS